MILTARQLEDLHRAGGSNGHLTVPYRARLTPLALDFIRARKIVLGYSDVEAPKAGATPAAWGTPNAVGAMERPSPISGKPADGKAILWWCDGPCGPAKAAISALARETPFRPLDDAADPRQLIPVIKSVAAQLKGCSAGGAVLLVKSGATAMVYANRCPSLRAVLGTCLDSVDQAMRLIGANVLVIEHPYATLQQTRNLVSRFLRGPRDLPEDVRQQLAEVASCV